MLCLHEDVQRSRLVVQVRAYSQTLTFGGEVAEGQHSRTKSPT